MKRFFTLTLVALLASVGVANAQSLRKTWDFRDGFSQKTVNALKADQEEFGDNKYWRNYEGDATKADEQHFWCASKDAKNSAGIPCTHNGGVEKIIPELDGLVCGFSAAKKFVITYNGATYPNEFESEGGPALGEPIPHGNSYVWLNGKNETIKFQAEVNQTIKIGIESHAVNRTKLGEARGITLSTSAGSLSLTKGEPKPTYYTECEWELTGSDGEIAELTLKSTNGCHIYYIIVGEGDDPNANKKKVAYLTDGDGAEEEALETLNSNDELVVNVFDVNSIADFASVMADNEVAVISPKVPATSADLLKSAIAFYPIVNLNADLYEAWGYGEAVVNPNTDAFTKNIKHDIFAGFEEEADYNLADDLGYSVELTENEAGYKALKLGEYFAADDSLLVNDGEGEEKLVAVHAHNIYHNGYIYLPFADATEPAQKMLFNAISTLSKEEITKVSAPKISLTYKDQLTKVSMAMASASYKMSKIYYTIDGTEPTEASLLYTDTVSVTEPTTFKAVAIADGYLLSDVTEALAEIYSQPTTPAIELAYEDGKTVVSISCETEDVTLWYNYSEATDTTKSMKYAGAFDITAPTTVTAFAVAGGMVFSELATQRVTVKNPIVRLDQVGLFDANAAEWQKGGSGSTIYYFSWGKSAQSIYDTTADPIGIDVDPETGDEITIYPEKEYEFYVPSEEAAWEVKSKGQVMIWQSLTTGSDPGNDSGYNPETAGDILSYAKIISNDIQFGGKTSGEPCTGAIQSRVKFAGPFDVVTHVGTAAGGENVGRMQLQVSTDSLEWTNLGEEMTTSTVKRLWKSYTRSYNGTDEVYVRVTQAGGGSSVQIYDMYILNEGENSVALKQQYEQEYEEATTGIQNIQNSVNAAIESIYGLNGMRKTTLQRGFNIVRYSDGTAKKVMVK